MARIDLSNTISDRALALQEQGLESWQIAERLGIQRGKVAAFVRNALKKRARRQAMDKALTEATLEVTRI